MSSNDFERDAVYICSRFRSLKKDPKLKAKEQKANEARAITACKVAVDLGFEPKAPHLYLPRFLDDDIAWQRELGMIIGLDWLRQCQEVWVFGYSDASSISEGMAVEIEAAKEAQKVIRYFGEPDELMLELAEAIDDLGRFEADRDAVAAAINMVLNGHRAV